MSLPKLPKYGTAARQGLAKKIKSRLYFLSGISTSVELFKSLRYPWKGMISSRRELLKSNLEMKKEFEQMEFHRAMRTWGIWGERDAKVFVRAKKRELCTGAFLFLVGIVSAACQMWGTLMGSLGLLACLSVALLGLLLMLTSWWRLRLIAARRFVPFLKWLRQGGRL